ncbi:MAG: pilus assembly PilX N-terminal domain-containing protein [Planctomycetes bacterium]|nr:pilus assembly PilX N-terminal domain-containing protein [Planctomycetota bacterium]
MILRQHRGKSNEGNALLVSIVTMTVLLGLSAAALTSSIASKRQIGAEIERTRALYAAEAGVASAMQQLVRGQQPSLGSVGAPSAFASGGFWGGAVQNLDKSWTITSVGTTGLARRALEVTLTPQSGGIYDNALFAGNSSGDPSYVMKFGGTKTSADKISGNIYSGQNVVFNGDATIDGTPRALGLVSASSSTILPEKDGTPRAAVQGQSQPLPDITGMHYATNNDVDVAKTFKAAKYASGTGGGKAWQMPATDPAHIFRLNPNDRTANTSTTAKDDYFLEDPYVALHTDPKSDGSDPFMIQLSDPAVTKGATQGNNKVYYIDGNLWVHNLSSMSMEFASPSGGVQITIVVSGNIYMSDNLYLKDKNKDGIALIALKDPAVKDSGNIYFGDPTFGTLEHMSAYMYAENNFYDNNLSATGSAIVSVDGNMTAGNQVAINRDVGKAHSKLTVNFDNRISTKKIALPGLPKTTATSSGLKISLWREVAVP